MTGWVTASYTQNITSRVVPCRHVKNLELQSTYKKEKRQAAEELALQQVGAVGLHRVCTSYDCLLMPMSTH